MSIDRWMDKENVVPQTRWNTAAAAAKSLQSCLTLCDPIDGSPSGSTVPGILQARTRVGCHFLLQCMKVKVKSLSRVRLFSNPMDCSLPGSSIHGIFWQEYWSGVPLPSPTYLIYLSIYPTICHHSTCDGIHFHNIWIEKGNFLLGKKWLIYLIDVTKRTGTANSVIWWTVHFFSINCISWIKKSYTEDMSLNCSYNMLKMHS